MNDHCGSGPNFLTGARMREKLAFVVRYRVRAILNTGEWTGTGVGRARVEHVVGMSVTLRGREGVKGGAQVVR